MKKALLCESVTRKSKQNKKRLLNLDKNRERRSDVTRKDLENVGQSGKALNKKAISGYLKTTNFFN